MTSKQRSYCIRVLTNKCGYDKKEGKNIEKCIYEMCVKLGKTFDNTTNEIYAKYAYEKIGQLYTVKDDHQNKEKILADIVDCVLDYDSCVFDEYHLKENHDTESMAEGIKISNGEFQCKNPKCKSKKTYYFQSQTRKADESATTFVVCTVCGNRYNFG